jgi:hypothetical protein
MNSQRLFAALATVVKMVPPLLPTTDFVVTVIVRFAMASTGNTLPFNSGTGHKPPAGFTSS